MSKRSDSLYVRDIKEAIEAIFSYTRGITFDDFKFDRMRYSAVIREFELIGEAVGNLADTVKENSSAYCLAGYQGFSQPFDA